MTTYNRVACALMVGAALLASNAIANAQSTRLDAVVEQALREGTDLPVIVRYKTAAGAARGRAGSGPGSREIGRELKSMRALGMRVNARALRDLLANADVEHISFDAPVEGQLLGLTTLTTYPVAALKASGAPEARSRYGVNGTGVTVAIIDSGVKPHADLPLSRITGFVDFVNGRTTAYDDYGHGTHVAGIIAGNGASSNGQYTGVAPGASIVALKVLDGNGAGRTTDVMAALEWVLVNHAQYGIRIVNLSLGHPIYEAAATDPMVQLVETLTRRGIVVVVSAGNMGRNALGQTVYGSITSPANAQGAITVGATRGNDTVKRSDDAIASFSSRGPTRYDYYVKPDVVAPGYGIMSLAASDSLLQLTYPLLQPVAGYQKLNGTSMSAPAVAGAAALVLQANPTLTAHTVKAILQFTSQRMSSFDVMTQGAGQINVAGAVRLAKMIYADATPGKRWLRSGRKPIGADLLSGENVFWGRAIVWGKNIVATNQLYVRATMWDDNIVWGMDLDNIVWGMDDSALWGMLMEDNIVWGMMLDDNIVWGMTDDNIVWGFDDNVVWGANDSALWADDNLVWGMGTDSVMAFSTFLTDNVDGQSFTELPEAPAGSELVDGQAILTEGEVR
jgi:serine protease AprX